jgi:hypothetical protein
MADDPPSASPVRYVTVALLFLQILCLLQQAEPKSYQGVYVAGDIILGKLLPHVLGPWKSKIRKPN